VYRHVMSEYDISQTVPFRVSGVKENRDVCGRVEWNTTELVATVTH